MRGQVWYDQKRCIAFLFLLLVSNTLIVACKVLSSPSDFPLAVDNTWIFQATRFEGVPTTEIITTTLLITETVVEVKSTTSYFAAKIHRNESAEEPVGNVPPSWQGVPLRAATSSDYWFVVRGNRLYRQENDPNLNNLNDTATLELVFPLKIGEAWYLSDEKAKVYPNLDNEGMLRRVLKVDTIAVPAGTFNHCFLLTEEIGGSTFETWFCPGIGWVERKSIHHGTPMEWFETLVKYQVRK